MKKIFNYLPVYALLSTIGFFCVVTGVIDFGHDRNFMFGLMSLIIGIFTVIPSFVSVFTHMDDLARLKEKEDAEINAKDFLNEVKEHIKIITEETSLDDNLLAKSNVDHPVVAAFDKLVRAEAGYERTKNNVSYRKSKIAARKAGPFSWVVDMYGESL